MIVFVAAGLICLLGLVVIADVVRAERHDKREAEMNRFLDGHPFVGEAATPGLQLLRMDPADAVEAERRALRRWFQ